MATVIEEFERLKELLNQTRMTYHIAEASYALPKSKRGEDMTLDDGQRVIHVNARYGGSVIPQESLGTPLIDLTISIDNFGGYDFTDDTVFLDVQLNRRRIRLNIIELYGDDKSKKAKYVEQAVRQIAQHLSYKFSVERD